MNKPTFAAFILLGLNASFTLAEDSALDKRIADLRARGEPVLIEDFRRAPIDPKDNARDDIEAAIKAIQNETPEYSALDRREEDVRLPVSEFEQEQLAAISRQNEQTLSRMTTAAAKPQAIADIKWESPVIKVLLPSLNGMRSVVNLLRYDFYHQVGLGMPEIALARVDQIDVLARYADSNDVLVGMLVATGIRSLSTDLLVQLAPQLPIGDAAHQIPRPAVEKRIAGLLEHAQLRATFTRSIQAERMSTVDTLEALRTGKITIDQLSALMSGAASKPAALEPAAPIPPVKEEQEVFGANALAALDYYDELLKCFGEPDNVATEKRMAESTLMKDLAKAKTDPRLSFVAVLLPSLNRIPLVHFTTLTKREAAAAALAMRLYAIDHGNKLPEKLDELVPKYLPRLPRDYLADNQPLKYRAGEKAILWSIGRDGVDNGAAAAPANRRQADDIFPLIAPRRISGGN
ncbi:MAG: hypothetical protein H7144_12470 [Burkholderiales bacterium]|nr:hypothetical protein [Phycisphaerae bacterium]